jgi:hypothetical protein
LRPQEEERVIEQDKWLKRVPWKNFSKMADTAVSIRVIPFTGKKEDWPVWLQGCSVGKSHYTVGRWWTYTATATQAEKDEYNKARELNDLAYEEMVLCIDGTTKPGKGAFGCVNGAVTADIQLGSAREAWKRLNNKFEPKTAPSHLRLQNLFHKSYLQSNQDPDEWITELEEFADEDHCS